MLIRDRLADRARVGIGEASLSVNVSFRRYQKCQRVHIFGIKDIFAMLLLINTLNFRFQISPVEPGAGCVAGWWVRGVTQQAMLSEHPGARPSNRSD